MVMNKKTYLNNILNNIDAAREYSRRNDSVSLVALVSGSPSDRASWEKRIADTGSRIFNSDGSTLVLSLEEKIGDKTRQGNFLGTLLAYRYIKEAAAARGIDHRDRVVLMGMIFGRGERISPITQSKGCCKASVEVGIRDRGGKALTSNEEALMYFAPVVRYLEKRGFRGILDKWGDETEVASVDLTEEPEDASAFAGHDVIKVISVVEITEELARQKDWVVFDADGNMLSQLSRNTRGALIDQLRIFGVEPDKDGRYHAGVSLGPAAVSYDVLDIAGEVFSREIETDGIYFDFDPYFLMALAMEDDPAAWDAAAAGDASLRELLDMVPDFFAKVQRVKSLFAERHGRPLNIKILDLGNDVYWADIGQHRAMREKFMALNDEGPRGVIARSIAGVKDGRDADGNIVINAEIASSVSVKDSVVINTRLTGKGTVTGSVIVDSELADVDIKGAFAVRSERRGRTVMAASSGIYGSLGADDLVLGKGMRHVSVLTAGSKTDMTVSEDTDLRDKDNNYNVPIYGNTMSFEEAYNVMCGVSMEELEKRRTEEVKKLHK